MNNQLRTIRLYGKLGTQFGRVHYFDVASAAEAVRALGQIDGFERAMMSSKDCGIAYAVFIGKRNLSERQLDQPPGREDIRIAPILLAAKHAGLFQTILGAALVFVGAVGETVGQAVGGGLWGSAAINLGIAMAVGGVVQMLTPTQKGLSTQDSGANTASYAFNGPVNTTVQGNPVPYLAGEMIVGSAVISAGIYAEDKA